MLSKKVLSIIGSFIAATTLIFVSLTGVSSVAGQITYRLDWRWGQALPAEQGWMVTNDLGYQVHLKQGYLVTYSTELIECPSNAAQTSWHLDQIGPQPAYAGHGADPSEARITASVVEDLAHPLASTIETVAVTASSYCQGHYVIGPAGVETTRNLPQQIDLIGTSLFIQGDYQDPETAAITPFTIQTKLPGGVIADLTSVEAINEPVQVLTGSVPIEVTLRRDLGSLFDGVDFGQMSEQEQARGVLRSLTGSTSLLITQGDLQPHP